ncbi:putative heme utilization radical SAM enzyme HutW [Halorhodospira abdelmalekii]|uniref:heme anaerobic degradation radical SAM methyltransferase ChuW/HutW n=1 Tax=Halorhodospira abdelmalekii TaxID=421629 RepID=UPI0019075A40|nr:heme anaerobic degradation radical SAM methyltransferase ChuW/HutW [Halorhodospira abdelmalekii]MBK1735628.1 putative heme utilization radical SAM enzyme HutW [Halorhodospira abdelmalekii]
MLPELEKFYTAATDDPVRFAFSGRTPMMPRQEKQFVTEEERLAIWQRIEQSPPNPGKRVVYVNIPFCVNHCLYCGFFRNRYSPEKSAEYVELLIREIAREAHQPYIDGAPIHALYLGGGTPSALETPHLVRLLHHLRTQLPLAADCEITVEGRVLNFDDDKVDACFDCGVNRLSIGIQSFDTRVRQQQGRRMSGEDAAEFIAKLLRRDRGTVILDLMYGLPWQTPEVWQRDLETCLELAPDGIDVYALKRIPGTPLDKAITNEKIPPTSTLAEQGALYQQATTTLQRAGWRQISNSHWARTPRERNLYNLLIKAGAECLAFGSGAGGSIEPYSYGIATDISHYIAEVARGRKPLGLMTVADAAQPLRDFIMGSVEIGRLDLRELSNRLPQALGQHPLVLRLIERWLAAGLAERHDDCLLLTTAGRFWAPNLIGGLQGVCAHLLASELVEPDGGDCCGCGNCSGGGRGGCASPTGSARVHRLLTSSSP